MDGLFLKAVGTRHAQLLFLLLDRNRLWRTKTGEPGVQRYIETGLLFVIVVISFG
jgi:hypothetical protein